MNCRQARDLLPLYADGELDGAKRAGVAEHLRQCPRCRERLELDIRLAAELAAYGPEAAGHVDLRSKVMAQVDRERRRQPIRRMALRLGNVAVGLVVSAVAVALLVGIALTVRPLAERAWPAAPPPATATAATEALAAPEFGAPHDLFELAPAAGANYGISPRRGWLAYMAPEETLDGQALPRRLVARHLETGQTVNLWEDPPAEAQVVGWTGDLVPPRQSAIILLGAGNQQKGALLIRDLSAQAPTIIELPQGTEQGFEEAAISPDGRRIAFTVAYETPQAPVPKIGIDVVDLDGSGRRQIVAPDYFIGHLAWSPDGTQVVYFKGKGGTPPEDGDAYVVRVAGGEPRLLFPRLRLAAWSPGGTQALWLSEPADDQGRADLYLSTWPPSGQPRLVAKGADMAGAAWAGSDGWFVYGQGGALYLASAGGSAPVRLTPEGEVAGAPVWVPGKGLVYRAERGGRAVLRLLPVAGTQAPTPAATAEELTATATWQGATGSLAGRILFTKWGSAPLTLQGVPQVAIQDASGAALQVQMEAMAATSQAGPVTLQPGARAAVQFVWRNYCGLKPAGPLSLRVTLPSGEQIIAPVLDPTGAPLGDTPRCDEPSAASALTVGAFEPVGVSPTPTPALARSEDAGALRAFRMLDAQSGWALAERAILRTADGGATWSDVTPNITRPAGDGGTYWAGQLFIDRDHAWVLVARGQELTLLRTADAGRTWQAGVLPVEGMGALFTSLDAARGWALVGQGVAAGSEAVAVLATEDGGATWAVLSLSDPQNPQPGQVPFGGNKRGLGFADAAHGWLSVYEPVDGKVVLYATHDGGRTWAEQDLALPAGYEDAQAAPEAPVFFSAQDGVLAVGLFRHEPARALYITRDGGATWTPTPPFSAAVGGAVRTALLSAGEGWALVQPVPGTTDRVELRHTTDGGLTWTALSADPALAKVVELQFVDRDHGWALCAEGESTYLLKTADGGRTWARVP